MEEQKLEVTSKEKALAIAAHVGWLIAGMGYVLLPLGIYLITEKRLPFAGQHAKQALKAQILSIPMIICIMLCGALAGGTMILYAVLLFLSYLLCSLYACYKAINGEEYCYPLLNGGVTKKKALTIGGVLLFMLATSVVVSQSSDDKKDVAETKSTATSSTIKSSQHDSSTSSNNSSTSTPAPSSEVKPSKPKTTYEEISAQDMMAILEVNPAKAKNILLNQNVKITGGRLGYIDADGDSFALDSGVVTNIRCQIKTKEAADALLDLVKGQSIVVYGKVARVGETLGYSIHVTKLEPSY